MTFMRRTVPGLTRDLHVGHETPDQVRGRLPGQARVKLPDQVRGGGGTL